MAALTAIVIALGIAVAANFLLLLAVIRRLRLQRTAATPQAVAVPEVGMQLPSFAAQDLDGNRVDESFYTDSTEVVVAFFSDDCMPCERVKAELVREPIADPVLAFVRTSVPGTQRSDFATDLSPAGAKIILLGPDSEIPQKFSISAFPTLLRARSGVVVAASLRLSDVRGKAAHSPHKSRVRALRHVASLDAHANGEAAKR